MADPAEFSSQFIAGPTLTSAQCDVDADLIPYFLSDGNGGYTACTISPAELYAAMSA